MSPKDDGTTLCAQVFDRLVEAGAAPGTEAVAGDRRLAEHLGSCVTCFRALTDLRDAPRVAEALRAAPTPVPHPDDRFWEALAERTVAATERALRGGQEAEPARRRTAPARAAWRRFSGGGRRGVASLAAALAAAAAWVIVARHANVPSPGAGGRAVMSAGVGKRAAQGTRAPTAYAPAEDGSDETADVADLDTGALERLLARVRAYAPAGLASTAESGDNADVVDDEARVSDEVADLDPNELRRVASSLEAGVH